MSQSNTSSNSVPPSSSSLPSSTVSSSSSPSSSVTAQNHNDRLAALLAQQAASHGNQIYRVVLTGGPCGGKTTAVADLTERFQALGWRVWRSPEAANLLISGGMNFYSLTSEQQYQFQVSLLKFMIALEDSFLSLARMSNQRSLVLFDRGCMDVRAYMSELDWERMMKELNYNTVTLRDSRYDCVLHLVTAADGARQFYSCEGHASRSEPPELAAEIDGRIKNNWIGHPYFHVIDNRTDFAGKIARVSQLISKFLGLSAVSVRKRKFLIQNTLSTISSSNNNNNNNTPSTSIDFNKTKENTIVGSSKESPGSDIRLLFEFPDSISIQEFDVEHTYLLRTDGTQARLRKRGQGGLNSYSYTLRYADLFGQRLELKRSLTRREYYDMLLQRDESRSVIRKKRYSFLYNNNYFELDIFRSPQRGLCLLETYTDREADPSTVVPPFLTAIAEVTDNPLYSMYHLGHINNSINNNDKNIDRKSSQQLISISSSVPGSPILSSNSRNLCDHAHTSITESPALMAHLSLDSSSHCSCACVACANCHGPLSLKTEQNTKTESK